MTLPKPHLRGLTLVAVAALLAIPAFAGPAGATTSARTLTVYALATRAQFTNHADDRQRGLSSNPFNVDTKKLPPILKTEKGKGGKAGDRAIYGFKLFSDAAMKKRIGTAVYTCTFNFGNVAFCSADFQLNGGAMYASGPADFNSTTLTLAVSGGTGPYLGRRGQVSSAPHASNAHRLTFLLR
jgi:hypothetical protein